MRRTSVLLIVCISTLLVAASGCGGGSPQAVAQSFVKALASNNLTQARQLSYSEYDYNNMMDTLSNYKLYGYTPKKTLSKPNQKVGTPQSRDSNEASTDMASVPCCVVIGTVDEEYDGEKGSVDAGFVLLNYQGWKVYEGIEADEAESYGTQTKPSTTQMSTAPSGNKSTAPPTTALSVPCYPGMTENSAASISQTDKGRVSDENYGFVSLNVSGNQESTIAKWYEEALKDKPGIAKRVPGEGGKDGYCFWWTEGPYNYAVWVDAAARNGDEWTQVDIERKSVGK